MQGFVFGPIIETVIKIIPIFTDGVAGRLSVKIESYGILSIKGALTKIN